MKKTDITIGNSHICDKPPHNNLPTDYDLCIIGAGMSGMVAAIEAARGGLSVLICDRNKKSGTKLYATGNGRCNLANTYQDDKSYYNNPFAKSVLGDNPCDFTIRYFEELGIMTYDRAGYVYPLSNQASSVVWALNDALKSLNVTLKINTEVKEIKKEGSIKYRIFTADGAVTADRVILATGGISQSRLGAPHADTLYGLFDSLNLEYAEFSPSLTSLAVSEDLSDLAGVRTAASAELYSGSRLLDKEYGELQITDSALSGIMIFNLSHYYNEYEDLSLKINLLPALKSPKTDLGDKFPALRRKMPEKRLKSFLNGIINDRIADFMIKKVFGDSAAGMTLADTDEIYFEKLIESLMSWELRITGISGFDKSQVSKGGIITDGINPLTMEIKANTGLYAAGEAVNVDGKCGGYNLMWAVRSGYLAGRAAAGPVSRD